MEFVNDVGKSFRLYETQNRVAGDSERCLHEGIVLNFVGEQEAYKIVYAEIECEFFKVIQYTAFENVFDNVGKFKRVKFVYDADLQFGIVVNKFAEFTQSNVARYFDKVGFQFVKVLYVVVNTFEFNV